MAADAGAEYDSELILQRAVQLAASPESTLLRQADVDARQDFGQASGPLAAALSHDSPGSTTPLPQVGGQSRSVRLLAPGGQQPSQTGRARTQIEHFRAGWNGFGHGDARAPLGEARLELARTFPIPYLGVEIAQ